MHYFTSLLLIIGLALGQHTQAQQALDPDFDKVLKDLLSFTVPTIDCKTLHDELDKVILLDTREDAEYNVSHIPGAIHVGYEHFNVSLIKDVDRDVKIVVYCSVGYRSEKIGERLLRMGFTNVYNLYGSIFEWSNHGYNLVENHEEITNRVHSVNASWAKWIDEAKPVF